MNEFGIVILCIMGIGTLSVILNIYLAYHINRLERENEELEEWIEDEINNNLIQRRW